jgi:protein Cut8
MGSSLHHQYIADASPGKTPLSHFGNNLKLAIPKRMANKRKGDFTEGSHSNMSNFVSLESLRTKNRIIKKQRNSNQVFGQKLPLNRVIETLDKNRLQDLIKKLIQEKPELTTTILEASPEITADDALKELKRKLDLILTNIPYKVETTSDYSFLRVKPFVDDFFQSLSDYSLNFIPPVENDLTVCISFLKRFLLEVFHKLPQFMAVEFKYFYNITVDKFNVIFLDCISQYLEEKKQNILLVINEEWLNDFKRINQLNYNHFSKVQSLLEDELNKYYSSGSVILNNEPLEAHNGATKLSGLENLLNFAYQNNPLSNTTLNNI